jgi:iron complex outermembrane receptor protein
MRRSSRPCLDARVIVGTICPLFFAAVMTAGAQAAEPDQTAGAAPSNTPPPVTATPEASTEDNGQNAFKNMSLEELMNQDVTSVSKQAEPLLDAPSAIQVITNEEIVRSGASSLPEALRLADNLQVAQDNSHDWNITARGFNTGLANKLLVLIDGRTIYTPLYSGVIWDEQNPMLADLDRIEVISGPGGTLWGANAVNGVINIISKSAEETQGWYTEASAGSQPRDEAAIRYGGTLAPNVYYRVYGQYFDRNNEIFSDGVPGHDSWSDGRGGFRIDTAGSSEDKFTVQGDYYNGAEGHPTLPGTDTDSGGNILGRWSHTFSADSDTSLQIYYDRTNLTVQEPALALEPAGIFGDDLDTADLSFQHNLQLDDRNHIVWGFGYRFTHDVASNAPSAELLPATLDQNLYNIFGQDEIKLLDNLFLTLGSKVEHNDYTGFEYEPSARLQWNFVPNQMLWAAVSRAVRTPSRLDRDLYEPTGLPAGAPQSVLDGSTSFSSEKLIAYELGYRAQFSSQVSGSISAYYNDYSDIRSTTPGPAASGSLPIILQNNLEGQTYGVEASSDYQMLDWWRWHAGYDYLQEHIHVKPGEVDFTNGLNETADPSHQVFLRSSMDLPQNIQFDTEGRWIDQLIISNGPTAATVPGYFELNARLGWQPVKNVEVSVVGENLLHAYHAEYGFPGPTQEAIQRSVYGKITWRF